MARTLSVLFWVVAWAFAAIAIDNDIVLVGPVEVCAAFMKKLANPLFWDIVGHSSARIAIGFFGAACLGVTLGMLASAHSMIKTLLAAPLQLIKSTPVVCIVVVLLISLGSSRTSHIIVALVVIPPYYFATIEAAASRNDRIGEVFSVFRTPFVLRFLCLTWPDALPFLQAATKSAVGMAWKAGITAELIALPLASLGEEIYVSKLTLDTAGLLSLTFAVVLLGWLSEKTMLTLLAVSRRSTDVASRIASRHRTCHPDRDRSPLPRENAVTKNAPSDSFMDHSNPQKASKGRSMRTGTKIEVVGIGRIFKDGTMAPPPFTSVFEVGSRTCVMAPTGTGKTSLLRLLAGIDQPDSGMMRGVARCSFMFQETRLIEYMNAIDNVQVTIGSSHLLSRVAPIEMLSSVLPPASIKQPVSELSGGMRRLVELVRTLAFDSNTVILDEPFSGLDSSTKQRAIRLIDKTLFERTLIMASHNTADAQALHADIVNLAPGELPCETSPLPTGSLQKASQPCESVS